MSREDNQSCVAQCLHLGAVDYLVKPLRRNELNNLWAHVWRRRMVRRPSEIQSHPIHRTAEGMPFCSSLNHLRELRLLGVAGALRADVNERAAATAVEDADGAVATGAHAAHAC
jgi:DNA-binding response OmpR family regulator